jgi:hypothetical protein
MSASFLASRLREEIERLPGGISGVATKVGKARNTVYNWMEHGNIPVDELMRLAQLGLDVQYVLTGERWGDYGRKDKELFAASNMERGMLAAAMVLEVVSELPASQKDRISSELVKMLCAFVYEQCPTKDSLRAFLRAGFLVKDASPGGEADQV